MMFLILATAFFLGACGGDADTTKPSSGQEGRGDLQGAATLSDADEHAGIVIMAGSVEEGQKQTTTGADGGFLIEDLPAGEIEVVASYEGYRDASKTVEIRDDETTNVTFELEIDDEADSENEPPVIEELSVDATLLERGGAIDVEVVASDPDEDDLEYTWALASDDEWTIDEDASEAAVGAPETFGSSATLEVEVSDGLETVRATEYLETNTPPEITRPYEDMGVNHEANPSPVSSSRAFEYQVEARDVNGSELEYSIEGIEEASIDENGLITWTPDEYDIGETFELTIEVSDSMASATRSLELAVGEFQMDATLPTRLDNSGGMAFGDFDDDSYADVVYVAHGDSSDLSIGYGAADGFSEVTNLDGDADADGCASPAVGDVDDDQDLDIVVICNEGNSDDDFNISYYVWINDGDGNFTAGDAHFWDLDEYNRPFDVEFADMNHDGVLDLVAASSSNVIIAYNDGSGNFDDYEADSHPSREYVQIEAADLDGDDRPELLLGVRELSSNTRGLVQVRSYPSENVETSNQYVLGTEHHRPNALGVGDMNGDGLGELVVLEHEDPTLFLYKNDGDGDFEEPDDTGLPSRGVTSSFLSSQIAFGDLNGDGNTDFVFGSYVRSELYVIFGDGDGSLLAGTTIHLPGAYGAIYGTHVSDWNGDGSLDVIVADGNGRIGVVY